MMGLRVRVREGEPVGQALRRLKRHVGFHQDFEKWYRRGLGPRVHVKPSKIRGIKKFLKTVKARDETDLARHLGLRS